MGDFSAGDKVEFVVTAKVVCTYRDSDRVKLRWYGGEKTIHPSNARLKPNHE